MLVPSLKHIMLFLTFVCVLQIQPLQGRYDGFMQVVSSAYVVPNFTENGWGLTRAPESLMEDLRAGIRDGLPNARTEHKVDVITGDRPLFIDNWPLAKRVSSTMS
jgi:hypothetical protein